MKYKLGFKSSLHLAKLIIGGQNGKWQVYIPLLPKSLHKMHYIHPSTHGGAVVVKETRRTNQPAQQEQKGVQCLAQGHYDTVGVGG